jgi:SNF2 family DNA or RNA helicase
MCLLGRVAAGAQSAEKDPHVKYSALPYQKDGIRFMLDHPRCGVFADPGGGKTAMALAAFTLAKQRRQANRALIIAPRLVCYDVWPNEIAKWEQFTGLKCAILHGEMKAQEIFQQVVEPTADICLINPEGVDYLFSFFPEKWFTRKSGPPIALPWDWLIVDESSKFKNPSAVRFKRLKKWHKQFRRRTILTGTPTPRSMEDLWSQVYLLDSGATLGKNITAYRRRYFEQVQIPGQKWSNWVLRKGAMDEIYKAIAPIIIRFDERMFAELPELIFNEIPVSLPEKALRYYESLEKDFFAELDGATTEAATAGAKYLLCRQIANGRHYDPQDKSKIVKVHDVKVEVLKNLVDELQGKPLLVAYYFKHDLDAIRTAFPKIPNIGSDTSTAEIVRNLDQWNKGELPVMAVHPDSMSHGLNMQAGGSDLFYYALPNQLESFLQLNKRLHRRGAKSNVRIHIPIAKGTVDRAIMHGLRSKTANQKALLDALLEYRAGKSAKADPFKV